MKSKENVCSSEEFIREAVIQNNGMIDLHKTGYELVHEFDWLGVMIKFKFRTISMVCDSVWVSYNVYLPCSLADCRSLLRELPEPIVIALANSIKKNNLTKQ